MKHTNFGAIWQFNYTTTGFYQHLTHAGWLFVSRFQQKWTERRKHPLTLPVCLMNFNLILPFLFSFFFLIPLYIFRISSVFINKVLKWFDGLNLSLFFHNHFTSFTFQKRTLLKCLNFFSSLAVSVNDHVFNQRGNLSQLLSNFHSEFAKIWHEDIRCYSFMVPGYLYCCFY